MEPLRLSVAEDYSKTPGSRKKTQGKFSGEEFRVEKLEPLFLKARQAGKELIVDLDGTAGYATSFLEEAFGGLARIYGPEEVARTIEILSVEEPYLVDVVAEYIRDAKNSQ